MRGESNSLYSGRCALPVLCSRSRRSNACPQRRSEGRERRTSRLERTLERFAVYVCEFWLRDVRIDKIRLIFEPSQFWRPACLKRKNTRVNKQRSQQKVKRGRTHNREGCAEFFQSHFDIDQLSFNADRCQIQIQVRLNAGLQS